SSDLGAKFAIGDHAPARIALHAQLVEAEPIGVRPAADGDEHDVGVERLLLAVRALHEHAQPFAALFDSRNLARQQELHALALQDALELPGDLAVEAGRDTVEKFDDGHLAAEPAPYGTELETDIARAHHAEPVRHAVERERAHGGDDALLVDRDARKRRHIGTG